MKVWSIALAALLFACSHLLSFAAQQPGTIRGSVLDENGAALAGARVVVDPLNGVPRADIVREVETDKVGHFAMDKLELGTYKVFAMKESSAYPNTAFAFYSNNAFPTVTLTASSSTAKVVLKMGPRAGMILGTVRNAVTEAPVAASFLLRRVSTNNWISMSQKADYRVLVPPSVEVSVEASAAGYKTWYYGGPSDRLHRQPIRLESGKEMKLNIQLEPEHGPEKQP